MADALTEHHDVATTLAVSPLAVSALEAARAHGGEHALDQLAALSGDQMLDQPYVPINVVALSEAGIGNEIGAQMDRGDQVLRSAGLKPDGGPWVDTASTFSQGDAGSLASGLQLAGASQAVISDADLSSGGESNQTFAQPFTLGPRARLHRGGRGRRLRPEHTLHRRPGQSGPRGRAAARRALVRALREPLLQRAARGRRRRRRRGGSPRPPSWTRCSAGSRATRSSVR